MSNNEIVYETDSSSLKNSDRNMRIYRAILIFLLDFAILFAVLFLSGSILISMISFLILAVLILPTPLLIVPSRYRIMKTGLDPDGKELFP